MDTRDKDNMQVRTLNAELHFALEGAIAILEAHEAFCMDEQAWTATDGLFTLSTYEHYE
jgi:hypothetical protein